MLITSEYCLFLKQCIFLLMLVMLSSCTTYRVLRHNVPSHYEHLQTFTQSDMLKKSQTPIVIPSSAKKINLNEKLFIINGQHYTLDKLLKKDNSQAFVVIKDGEIVYEAYRGRGGQDVRGHVWSVSKSWVVLLAAIAIEEDLFTLDDKVIDFMPELKNKVASNLTIDHLMDMRASLHYEESRGIASPFSRISRLQYSTDINKFVLKRATGEEQSNTHFHYQSIATQILGMIIERAAKQSFTEYFKIKLWNKLHMQFDGEWVTDDLGVARSFAGLVITPRDNAKMAQLILNNGQYNGLQIVPEWFINKIVTFDRPKNAFYYNYSFRFNHHAIPLEEWDGALPVGGLYQKALLRGGFNFAKKYFVTPYEGEASGFWADGFLGNEVYMHRPSNTIIVKHGNHLLSQVIIPWGRVFRAIATEDYSPINLSKKLYFIERSSPVDP